MQVQDAQLLKCETSQKIRATREKLGLTQEELALHLGVSRSTIKNWETGSIREFRLRNRLQLQRFLNGGLRRGCIIRKQICQFRHILHEHTPPELRHTLTTALKSAEQRSGGMRELLTALEIFLRQLTKRKAVPSH